MSGSMLWGSMSGFVDFFLTGSKCDLEPWMLDPEKGPWIDRRHLRLPSSANREPGCLPVLYGLVGMSRKRRKEWSVLGAVGLFFGPFPT